jgi:hypothetical protein
MYQVLKTLQPGGIRTHYTTPPEHLLLHNPFERIAYKTVYVHYQHTRCWKFDLLSMKISCVRGDKLYLAFSAWKVHSFHLRLFSFTSKGRKRQQANKRTCQKNWLQIQAKCTPNFDHHFFRKIEFDFRIDHWLLAPAVYSDVL